MLSYLRPLIIVVPFCSIINVDAFLINSSGFSLNLLNVSGFIFDKIVATVFLVSLILSANYPKRSYFTLLLKVVSSTILFNSPSDNDVFFFMTTFSNCHEIFGPPPPGGQKILKFFDPPRSINFRKYVMKFLVPPLPRGGQQILKFFDPPGP